MARVLGLEPRMTESKSVVLPLHYTRTINNYMIDDYTVQSIIDQLNSAHRKYSNDQQHLAWQQGFLIGVLAWAMKNDSVVRDHFKNCIRHHNETVGENDDENMFAALDAFGKK